jgi:3-oxoadipate enol-lactonase
VEVDVRGVRLAVEEHGEGPAFVWGHGLTSSRAHEDETGLFDWSGLGDRARLIRYDARGHGRSGASEDPEDYRWDRLAADLLGLADALGLDRFVAGGASMGAATALHAALLAPERVAGLVLAIPPTAWATRAAQADRYRLGAELAAQGGREALVEAMAEVPPPAIFAGRPELLRFEPATDDAVLPTVLRGAAASDLPPPERLRAVSVPALVLAWATDPGHPVATATALVDALPHARGLVAERLDDLAGWPAAVAELLSQARS